MGDSHADRSGRFDRASINALDLGIRGCRRRVRLSTPRGQFPLSLVQQGPSCIESSELAFAPVCSDNREVYFAPLAKERPLLYVFLRLLDSFRAALRLSRAASARYASSLGSMTKTSVLYWSCQIPKTERESVWRRARRNGISFLRP